MFKRTSALSKSRSSAVKRRKPSSKNTGMKRKTRRKKSRKKKKNPNAPKRPLSAFFVYCKAMRPTVKASNPGLSVHTPYLSPMSGLIPLFFLCY